MIEFSKLGWRPFKDSYIQHDLPQSLNKEHIEIISDLFDWLVDPCIEFIKANCKFQIQTSYIHLMFSTMRLYSCMMDEISQPTADLSAQVIGLWLQGLFVFALIWGLGGTLNSDSRKKFDAFLRELINNNENKPKTIKLSKVNYDIYQVFR